MKSALALFALVALTATAGCGGAEPSPEPEPDAGPCSSRCRTEVLGGGPVTPACAKACKGVPR